MRTSVRRGVLCSENVSAHRHRRRVMVLAPTLGIGNAPSGHITHSRPLAAPHLRQARPPPSCRQDDQAPGHAPALDHSYDQAPLQVTAKIHVPARAPVYTDLNPCTGTKNARRTIAGRQPYIRIRQPQNRDSQPPCEASGLWTALRTARWTTAVRNWPPSGRAPLRKGTPKTPRPFR